jgi:hypothetical protein
MRKFFMVSAAVIVAVIVGAVVFRQLTENQRTRATRSDPRARGHGALRHRYAQITTMTIRDSSIDLVTSTERAVS